MRDLQATTNLLVVGDTAHHQQDADRRVESGAT
jgi:hypothetical protein